MSFSDLLKGREGRHLCLDLGFSLQSSDPYALVREVVDATSDVVWGYKINPAPYFCYRGGTGRDQLQLAASRVSAAHLPLILDLKCGDTDSINSYWKGLCGMLGLIS